MPHDNEGRPRSRVLNAHEAADFLQMHYQTFLRAVRRKQIPGVKLGQNWKFLASDLENLFRTPQPKIDGKE